MPSFSVHSSVPSPLDPPCSSAQRPEMGQRWGKIQGQGPEMVLKKAESTQGQRGGRKRWMQGHGGNQQDLLFPTACPSHQINLAASPAAAQLINRAQSVNSATASGIAQQAVLLGNTSSPALTASQAQMYLRAQMVSTQPGPWLRWARGNRQRV